MARRNKSYDVTGEPSAIKQEQMDDMFREVFEEVVDISRGLPDSDRSNFLLLITGSDLTVDRTLSFDTGDADRVLTINGDATLDDWFDQNVKTTASPTFAGLFLTSGSSDTQVLFNDSTAVAGDAGLTFNKTTNVLTITGAVQLPNLGLKVLDTNASHYLSIVPGSDLSADRVLTIVTGDAARTITLTGNPTLADWFDQAVKTTSSPTFAALTLTAPLPIASGGTGAATALAAFNALSPLTTRGDLLTRDASNNIRKAIGAADTVLKSDATDPAWGKVVNANVDAAAAIVASKLVAAGSDTQVQFNDGTAFAGDAGLVYNKTTDALTLAGQLIISGASAGQIVFPATQNASADANTLDDYEEGSWTPVLTFATPGDLSVAYSTQVGSYTKIGNTVFGLVNIVTSTFTHTTAAGALTVTGLPFTVGTTDFGAGQWRGITKANYTDLVVVPVGATATLLFNMSGSGQVVASVAAGDTPTGGTIVLSARFAYTI